jgi:hypothetical protein
MNDRHEGFEDTQGATRGCTPKNDIQEEIEDTKGVIRSVNRRRKYKKGLNI